MNTDNVTTTAVHKADYEKLLNNALKTQDVQTKKIINNACLLLGVLIQNPGINIWDVDLRISIIKRVLNKRTDIQLEGLEELSDCLKNLKSSRTLDNAPSISNLDRWIEDKHIEILKQKGFEYVEDHYGDCNSNNTQGTIQKEISVSSNDNDLEEFEVIETPQEAVGEVADIGEDFVLL